MNSLQLRSLLQRVRQGIRLRFEQEAERSGVVHVPVHPFFQSIAARVLFRPEETRLMYTPDEVTGRAVAEVVSCYFNIGAWQYVSDGRRDTWQTPLLTIASGRGDCEDFSLTTASKLRDMGLPAGLALGTLWQANAWRGHAWCIGVDGQGLFHIECTSGAFFRELPATYACMAVLT